MKKVIYTIGHSNLRLKDFIAKLKANGIKAIVDVRRFPTSKFKHFKKERLEKSLPRKGIEYFWLGDLLGGFRKGGYRKYMKSKEFKAGLKKLIEIAKNKRTAIMCKERIVWRCHRRFIAKKLEQMGWKVIHI